MPVQLKRRAQAIRLIVRGPDEDQAKESNPQPVSLLWKEQRWFAAWSPVAQPSVLATARETGPDGSEMTRVPCLTFLVPDIVHRNLDGNRAGSLGTKKLLAMVPLPLDWGEHRRVLGLTG